MSAKLIKSGAHDDAHAPGYVPFKFPAAGAALPHHFLSPDQSRGTASVHRTDYDDAPRFRPRNAASPSPTSAAATAAGTAVALSPEAAHHHHHHHDVAPEKIEAEASHLLREAHATAERVLSDATARAGMIEREARERGYAEGQQAAFAQLSEEVEPLRRQLTGTLDELAQLRAALAAEAERDLVRLATRSRRVVLKGRGAR